MKRFLNDERLQLLALIALLLLFICGCASSPALRKMCIAQEHVLAAYVEAANSSITKDEQLLPEHRADWTVVGEKLLRNQRTINKLAGVKEAKNDGKGNSTESP